MRPLLITVAFITSFFVGNAQDYVPFPMENTTWSMYSYNFEANEAWVHNLILTGDTIVDSNLYTKVSRSLIWYGNLMSSGPGGNLNYPSETVGLIREDSLKKVWYFDLTGYLGFYGEERVIFDFGLEVGDTMVMAEFVEEVVADVYIGEYGTRTIEFAPSDLNYEGRKWIEGIGSLNRGLWDRFLFEGFGEDTYLVCYNHDSVSYVHEYEIIESPDFYIENQCAFYTGLNDIEHQIQFNLSPNPTTNQVIITFPKVFDGQVKVFDIQGALVMQSQLNHVIENRLDVSQLNQGLYLVQILGESGERGLEKLVVKN